MCDTRLCRFVGYSGSRVKMVAHLTGPGANRYFKGQRAGAGCLEGTDMRMLLEDLVSVKAAAPVWFDSKGYEEIFTFVREHHTSMEEQQKRRASIRAASTFFGGGAGAKRAVVSSWRLVSVQVEVHS